MKYPFILFFILIIANSWAQYLNPNSYPLVTIPIISYQTEDHNSEGFLITIDSTVYHFFRQDPGITGYHTGNGGRIMLRTSNDNGDTWSTPIVIYDSPYDDRNVHGGITENGRIIVTFRKYDAPTATHIEYCFMYSDDKAQTWHGPFTVATEGHTSGTNQIFGNNNIGYYNIIYSTNYCEMRHSWDGSNWDSIIYIWDYRLSNLYKISEASFTYLGNGVIIGLFRNESGILGENFFQVESYNYGLNWTEPTLTNIAEGFFCPSPWIFYEPVFNHVWVIATDRRGNFSNFYNHNQDAIWLYKMYPDEIIGNPNDYLPFLVFERPNPSFYRFYGYPASTKTPDGNYLVLFTESE
ncbi:MAG: sialidase family protein, partial [Bacteroidales bacterium]